MPHFSTLRSSRSHAFTIVEIMVASLVMALLVAGIITITVNFIKSYNNASAKLSSNYIGRSVLDFMERDLESAVFRNNGKVWMVVDYTNSGLSSEVNKGRFPLGRDDQSGIYFFSTPQDSDLPGAVAAMSYTLLSERPIKGVDKLPEGLNALYRNLETPRDTFDNILEAATEARALIQQIQFPLSDRGDYYLSENVHQLYVRVYVNEIPDAPTGSDEGPYILLPDSDGRITFPFNGGDYFVDRNSDGIPDSSSRQSTNSTINAPDFIDIDIQILSDELKQLLEVIEGGFTSLSDTETQEEINKGIDSFHKRIQINGSGI